MITQKPISARIKHETLWKIEQLTMATGITRNYILNRGAEQYIDLIDTMREHRNHSHNDEARRKILAGFLMKWASDFLIEIL